MWHFQIASYSEFLRKIIIDIREQVKKKSVRIFFTNKIRWALFNFTCGIYRSSYSLLSVMHFFQRIHKYLARLQKSTQKHNKDCSRQLYTTNMFFRNQPQNWWLNWKLIEKLRAVGCLATANIFAKYLDQKQCTIMRWFIQLSKKYFKKYIILYRA